VKNKRHASTSSLILVPKLHLQQSLHQKQSIPGEEKKGGRHEETRKKEKD
jgi:hypothetical protein